MASSASVLEAKISEKKLALQAERVILDDLVQRQAKKRKLVERYTEELTNLEAKLTTVQLEVADFPEEFREDLAERLCPAPGRKGSIFKYVSKLAAGGFKVKRCCAKGPPTNPPERWGKTKLHVEACFDDERSAVMFAYELDRAVSFCRCSQLYFYQSDLPLADRCAFHGGRCQERTCHAPSSSIHLIECSYCRREYHFMCAGLPEEPEGDWFCSGICERAWADRKSKGNPAPVAAADSSLASSPSISGSTEGALSPVPIAALDDLN